jgi:hypothetical protein
MKIESLGGADGGGGDRGETKKDKEVDSAIII